MIYEFLLYHSIICIPPKYYAKHTLNSCFTHLLQQLISQNNLLGLSSKTDKVLKYNPSAKLKKKKKKVWLYALFHCFGGVFRYVVFCLLKRKKYKQKNTKQNPPKQKLNTPPLSKTFCILKYKLILESQFFIIVC